MPVVSWGALGMGADGVMMGTAFMATEECPLKASAKEAMVRARPDDPELRQRVMAPPDMEAYNEILKMRNDVPLQQWLPKLERVFFQESGSRRKSVTDAEPSGEDLGRVVSLATGFINSVPTVKGFVDSIVREAEELLDSYQFLKTK